MGSSLKCFQMRRISSSISSISLSLFLALRTDCALHVGFLYAALERCVIQTRHLASDFHRVGMVICHMVPKGEHRTLLLAGERWGGEVSNVKWREVR